jgi:hypothetical protein
MKNEQQAKNNFERPGTVSAGRNRIAVVDLADPGELAALTAAVDELLNERALRERASDRYTCPR